MLLEESAKLDAPADRVMVQKREGGEGYGVAITVDAETGTASDVRSAVIKHMGSLEDLESV